MYSFGNFTNKEHAQVQEDALRTPVRWDNSHHYNKWGPNISVENTEERQNIYYFCSQRVCVRKRMIGMTQIAKRESRAVEEPDRRCKGNGNTAE